MFCAADLCESQLFPQKERENEFSFAEVNEQVEKIWDGGINKDANYK